MTGNDNIRLITRIYNKPFRLLREYVDDFVELGKYLAEPVRTYSADMRARLNFALSVAIDFDCYPIDEIIAVRDQRFQRRSHEELLERRADRSLILASHLPHVIKDYCSRALVLHRGRGKVFDDLDLALDIHLQRSVKPRTCCKTTDLCAAANSARNAPAERARARSVRDLRPIRASAAGSTFHSPDVPEEQGTVPR